MITQNDIQKIKQLRKSGLSGKQISKKIHKRYKDILSEIRKLENKPEPTKQKKLLSTSIKYLSKKKAIQKEKILIQKKQKRKIIQRVKKQKKQRVKKQKKIKEIEREEIEEIEEQREEHREEQHITKGYYTVTFSCTCLVSDRKIIHDFAVREELKDEIETLHNDNYPEHNLQKLDESETVFHEYSNKPSYPHNSATEKQKKFLSHLGYSKEEISTVKSKDEARKLINRR
jgi:hypothetical protein